MKKTTTAVLLVLLGFVLSGCNTIQGMGQDVQKAGNAIERAAK
ncbi:entericidin A/B family lipoprotein [Extensimonas sp. H3M7-6]|nr:entericidin A/B family lipoprotein [Extensimonas sp. H3M7-6]MDF1482945.1 entericidin A/B family lipoprotein [Extensimonas sp. H3M7-6]